MSIILIAAPECLQMLKAREEFADAQTFADTEALHALEIITRTRPDVVVLERLFAATARGATLINRISADPQFSTREIKIVVHGGENGRLPVSDPAGTTDDLAAAVAWGPEAPWQEMPHDRGGTRRESRPSNTPLSGLGAARTVVEIGLHQRDADEILRRPGQIETAQRRQQDGWRQDHILSTTLA